MGRQINFFLHPDDQDYFDKLLKSFGDVVLLPYYHFDNKISTTADTKVRDIEKEGSRIYLVRPEDFKDIKLVHIKTFNYWLVDDNSLPVLHFDRSVYRDNSIHRGRLYFQPQFLENMEWVKKSDDFVNWADKIIKTVRHKLKKHKYQMGSYYSTEYLGENALDWLDKTKAEVGGAGSQLIPTNITT
ncbi:MAG: hypothetical protein CVT94_13765 [Bacteroidetes bacterium HGW-Bacteroidetes-11]|jgi:hypothetical protein|nr:MAG: hypothetical protein CVT94_13765 [Bacteroidetes bacterium HGW-Bacteroidetes-11]